MFHQIKFMRLTVITCILLLLSQSAWNQTQKINQFSDSCLNITTRKTDVRVYLKDLSFARDTTLDKSYFENGLELSHVSGKVRIIGFTLYIECPGCDIYAFNICGGKIDQKKMKEIYRLVKPGDKLGFNPIYIELGGKSYDAPIFTVLIR